MKKTTLVIMAAGIGSRFGEGVKQLESVGPNGETIMEYSVYDALEAGFNKVIFIIRRDLEKKFREIVGKRIETITDVEYVFQELSNIPKAFQNQWERKKPWGTGQAVMSLSGVVTTPFLVINADDYYGKEAFIKLHEYMVHKMNRKDEVYDICMAGFTLLNTLSENGGVTRGICLIDGSGRLETIKETYEIKKTGNKIYGMDACKNKVCLDPAVCVSMNMWGLTPEFLNLLERDFDVFLKNLESSDIDSEYLLPKIIDSLLIQGKVNVKVLNTRGRWMGLTYKEDKIFVEKEIKRLYGDKIDLEK